MQIILVISLSITIIYTSNIDGRRINEIQTHIYSEQRTPKFRDYVYYPGIGFYKYHNTMASWFHAKQICEQEDNAHLAVINSLEEKNILVQLISKYPENKIDPKEQEIFIGFHDLNTEGLFETVTGGLLKDSGYYSWNPGQPNNADKNQHCGVIFFDGLLNDSECSLRLHFICEKAI